jgi:hypothetical protein
VKKAKKLSGISYVKARPEDSEFDITFGIEGRSPMQAILHFSAAEQMASVFSQLAIAVREHQSGTAQAVIAQDIKDFLIERDQWNDRVTIRFYGQDGTPYTFSAMPENANKIAERLKNEAQKPHRMGQA